MKRSLIVSTLVLALLAGAPAVAQDAPPPANQGAFDALSAGNQKIVSSIYESQLGSANDQAGGSLLTRDDIAAMKADTGWGNAYKQLYDQGLVTHRNLGQAISSYNHASRATATTTVVTTGDGQQIVSDKKGGGGGNATSAPSGGKAGGQAGGVKADHAKNAFVTTGAGGAVAAGPAVHSSAGGMGGGKAGGNNGHGKGGL
jgi:hypothetical protein